MNNEVLKAILDRRSIRSYTDQPVEQEKLDAVLQAAINSPSARNLQPWHFTVIQDKAMMDELEEGVAKIANDPSRKHIFYGAPMIILVSADSSSRWAKMDCGMATQNILLAAHSLGLGSCVIGFVMMYLGSPEAETTLKKLNLPEGYEPLYAITLGYPNVEPDARPREMKVSYL